MQIEVIQCKFDHHLFLLIHLFARSLARSLIIFIFLSILFAVPKECLDVQDNHKIQAGPDAVTPANCESSSDKCFMNNGWGARAGHPSRVPKCFYRKGAVFSFSSAAPYVCRIR